MLCCAWAGLSSAAGPTELRARHGLRLFTLERSCCYEALLLDEERGRLFAGAQNNLLSLALDDISQRDRKVRRRGGDTHATQVAPGTPQDCECPPGLSLQIYWPAQVEWREECNWAGKDITVSAGGCWEGCRGAAPALLPQHCLPMHSPQGRVHELREDPAPLQPDPPVCLRHRRFPPRLRLCGGWPAPGGEPPQHRCGPRLLLPTLLLFLLPSRSPSSSWTPGT